MRHLATRRAFFEPPINVDPVGVDLNQLLMLSVMQPMRIVVVAPESKDSRRGEAVTRRCGDRSPRLPVTPSPGLISPEPRALLSAPARPNAVPQLQPKQTTPGYRKLFADPGQWRVVWWGEFKEILARQLAHPERLRDTYRLPCYVQVIETERTVTIEELAAIYNSDKTQTPLYILTDDIAGKLDLVLPLRAAPQHDAPRAPNTLLAHERVFRLVAANDPTIDVVASVKPKPASDLKDKPHILKETIPDRFIKEWELKLSREEATYDMNAKRTFASLIRGFCQRFKQRNEFRKWQALLTGKSDDEQLWSVHPPAGMLAHSVIRSWAMTALEHGGYNAEKMIREWEIFWRRRGF